MSDLFVVGEEASATKLSAEMGAILTIGESVLSAIESERLETLVNFERRLSALNGRRQRSNRVIPPSVAVRFCVTDFLDIDQTATTATVRADVSAVTLRERLTPSDAAIRSQQFSATAGETQSMDTAGQMFRVNTKSGVIPTGIFNLELVDRLSLSQMVIDLAAMPSEPTILVEASSDGQAFVVARQTDLNGYRLSVWFTPMEVKFLRISLTPTHPDTLGGSSYTFGMTAFSGSSTEFQLVSELVSKPVGFLPTGMSLRLIADVDPNLTYFLAFNQSQFVELPAGAAVAVPGTAVVNLSGIGMDDTSGDLGCLQHNFPASAYLSTLVITQEGSDEVLRVAPGLQKTDINLAKLTHKYIGVNGNKLYFIRDDISLDIGKTFSIAYVTGPDLVTATLKVQLTTPDRTVTSVFHGAQLEEI